MNKTSVILPVIALGVSLFALGLSLRSYDNTRASLEAVKATTTDFFEGQPPIIPQVAEDQWVYTTDNGYGPARYAIIEEGSGPVSQDGDYVFIEYSQWNEGKHTVTIEVDYLDESSEGTRHGVRVGESRVLDDWPTHQFESLALMQVLDIARCDGTPLLACVTQYCDELDATMGERADIISDTCDAAREMTRQ